MELKDSVALVTGASRGIGRGIAAALAREGARLVISARGADALDEAHRELEQQGTDVRAVVGDVGDERQAAAMVTAALDSWGRLDLLVNNAGVGYRGAIEEMPTEQFDRLFQTNVRGPFLLIKAAVPQMKKQGGGTIVNISSLAGKNPVPNMAAYAASKWALHGLSMSILGELRRDKIRIIIVSPGSTASNFNVRPEKRAKADRILQPADIAEALIAALKLPARAMVSEIDLRPTDP